MNKKILIVDDESYIRLLLEQTLEPYEKKGVKIISASNGKQALDIIQSEIPDLVFLDVMMPEMNGFDVCQTVKKELQVKNVYIIILSAKGQEVDKKKGKEVGADDYMTKPFDPDIITERAGEILGLK